MAKIVSRFVIMTKKNQLIGIDMNSGGYPFDVGSCFGQTKFWIDKKEAMEYLDSFEHSPDHLMDGARVMEMVAIISGD